MSAAFASTLADASPECQKPPVPLVVQPLDLRGSSLLSLRQLRKLRMHEQQFLSAASAGSRSFCARTFPSNCNPSKSSLTKN